MADEDFPEKEGTDPAVPEAEGVTDSEELAHAINVFADLEGDGSVPPMGTAQAVKDTNWFASYFWDVGDPKDADEWFGFDSRSSDADLLGGFERGFAVYTGVHLNDAIKERGDTVWGRFIDRFPTILNAAADSKRGSTSYNNSVLTRIQTDLGDYRDFANARYDELWTLYKELDPGNEKFEGAGATALGQYMRSLALEFRSLGNMLDPAADAVSSARAAVSPTYIDAVIDEYNKWIGDPNHTPRRLIRTWWEEQRPHVTTVGGTGSNIRIRDLPTDQESTWKTFETEIKDRWWNSLADLRKVVLDGITTVSGAYSSSSSSIRPYVPPPVTNDTTGGNGPGGSGDNDLKSILDELLGGGGDNDGDGDGDLRTRLDELLNGDGDGDGDLRTRLDDLLNGGGDNNDDTSIQDLLDKYLNGDGGSGDLGGNGDGGGNDGGGGGGNGPGGDRTAQDIIDEYLGNQTPESGGSDIPGGSGGQEVTGGSGDLGGPGSGEGLGGPGSGGTFDGLGGDLSSSSDGGSGGAPPPPLMPMTSPGMRLMGPGGGSGDAGRRDQGTPLPGGGTLLPDGSTLLPDGSTRLPDGSTVLPDGSTRLSDGSTLLPDGSTRLSDGTVLSPDGSRIEGGESSSTIGGPPRGGFGDLGSSTDGEGLGSVPPPPVRVPTGLEGPGGLDPSSGGSNADEGEGSQTPIGSRDPGGSEGLGGSGGTNRPGLPDSPSLGGSGGSGDLGGDRIKLPDPPVLDVPGGGGGGFPSPGSNGLGGSGDLNSSSGSGFGSGGSSIGGGGGSVLTPPPGSGSPDGSSGGGMTARPDSGSVGGSSEGNGGGRGNGPGGTSPWGGFGGGQGTDGSLSPGSVGTPGAPGTPGTPGMPMMPPGGAGGAGGGGGGQERSRTTWLAEDEKVWGTTARGGPASLGRPGTRKDKGVSGVGHVPAGADGEVPRTTSPDPGAPGGGKRKPGVGYRRGGVQGPDAQRDGERQRRDR
ncbi:hypothetical protein ACFW4K_18035 [Nocardiopsis alba]|uniref:hypothetical protein n=1 Tax=Nocardiopsis alba TaxID=53437 RepID=UPI00366BACD4